MKVHLEDLRLYSFCPKLYEQRELVDTKSFAVEEAKLQELFKKLFLIVLRRVFTSGQSYTSKQVEKIWRKLFADFFCNGQVITKDWITDYNKSLIFLHHFNKWCTLNATNIVGVNFPLTTPLSSHDISLDIPLVLLDNEGIVLVFLEPLHQLNHLKFDSVIRFSTLAVADNVKNVVRVVNLSFDTRSEEFFRELSFVPNEGYLQRALGDFLGLVSSVEAKHSYPNLYGCTICPLKGTCKYTV